MSQLSHLDELEAEAIYIIREVAAECEKPVMLYSIGKDSSVMLHLAMKAFYPEKPPFPFLHIDTTWKFKDMIKFRDDTAKKLGIEMPIRKRLLSLTVRSAVAAVTLTIRFCLTVLWLSVSRASQLMLLIATSQPTTAVLSLPTHPVTRNIQETWL